MVEKLSVTACSEYNIETSRIEYWRNWERKYEHAGNKTNFPYLVEDKKPAARINIILKRKP